MNFISFRVTENTHPLDKTKKADQTKNSAGETVAQRLMSQLPD